MITDDALWYAGALGLGAALGVLLLPWRPKLCDVYRTSEFEFVALVAFTWPWMLVRVAIPSYCRAWVQYSKARDREKGVKAETEKIKNQEEAERFSGPDTR